MQCKENISTGVPKPRVKSRARQYEGTAQLGGILASLSLQPEDKNGYHHPSTPSPSSSVLKPMQQSQQDKSANLKTPLSTMRVPMQLHLTQDSIMSPLESPASLAQSIISYSTATTTDSNQYSSSILNNKTPVQSHAHASLATGAISEATVTSHSSETVSEYTQELVGIGLGLDSSSDEDYQQVSKKQLQLQQQDGSSFDSNDCDSGEEDSHEDDSELDGSYIVHEEYVPYGRKIDIDSDDDDTDGEEEENDHDYRGIKKIFEHYETSDQESGYESPMAMEDSHSFSSNSEESSEEEGTALTTKEEYHGSDVVHAVILNKGEYSDEDSSCSAVSVEIVHAEHSHSDSRLHQLPPNPPSDECSSDEQSDSETESDAQELITKRSYSHMIERQNSHTSSTSSSQSTKTRDSISLQRQISSISTSTLISTNKSFIVRKGKWTMGSRIGQGSFGVVHVGMNNITGKLMAIKSMNIPSNNASSRQLLDDIRREIDLMKSFHHANIVQYCGCEMDSKKQVLHIFQEWVPGGSITSLLKKFGPLPLAVVRSYLHQILLGLKYLHENHVLHRDIKGGNVLVNDEGIVKLADFGASKCIHVSDNGTVVDVEDAMANMTMRGTPYFMAPEVFEEKYGRKADIWSCVCVAYQMCTSNPPWRALGIKSPMKLFLYITNHEGPPPLDAPISRDHSVTDNEDNIVEPTATSELFIDLLKHCFHRDPSKRPSAKALLEHPFFTEDLNDDSILEDESIPGGSVVESSSGSIPFSPLRIANLKRSRLASSIKKAAKATKEDLQETNNNSDWPGWAKSGRTANIDPQEKSNPFGKK